MGDMEVYIRCDGCSARSRDIWTKAFDGNIWPLSLCGHHSDRSFAKLQAQGWNVLESEALTR